MRLNEFLEISYLPISNIVSLPVIKEIFENLTTGSSLRNSKRTTISTVRLHRRVPDALRRAPLSPSNCAHQHLYSAILATKSLPSSHTETFYFDSGLPNLLHAYLVALRRPNIVYVREFLANTVALRIHKHTLCGRSQQLRHSLGLMRSEKHSRLHLRLIRLSRPFGRNT